MFTTRVSGPIAPFPVSQPSSRRTHHSSLAGPTRYGSDSNVDSPSSIIKNKKTRVILAILGWALFFPFGAIFARYLKHKLKVTIVETPTVGGASAEDDFPDR
ncbi:Uncharacterized protein Fot_06889 [Forsythia ovata]|uniref:Uncharacterized protein n=1 Tax=Forsythia ovata TaxID=205694 RepID=A0ABD1WUX3_9LAMI